MTWFEKFGAASLFLSSYNSYISQVVFFLQICNMIIIKQFTNNWSGFDVQFRPLFEKEEEEGYD